MTTMNLPRPESFNVDASPVFLATLFKSGTKLLDLIVAELTGLAIDAPAFHSEPDYEDASPIRFLPGHFFTWHNVPSDAVQRRIADAGARPIFLVRNIYDLVVSQYFHFANDVDAEIGFSTGTRDYFAGMTLHAGLSLVICGATSERFHWSGYGYYLRQIQEMLRYAAENPCLVVVYDRLVLNKRVEIQRIADYLGIQVKPERIEAIYQASSLDSMRQVRAREAGTGAHFRKGMPGDHVNVLAPHHYDMISQVKRLFAPDLDSLCRTLGYGDVTAMPETPEPKVEA